MITAIIVGGGKVGGELARLMLADGRGVTVVEARPELAARLAEHIGADNVLQGSGTDPDLLELAGIRHAQIVAAMTGADEVNLVVASLARFEFGVARTIARVNDPRNAWMFTPEMGVDAAVNQTELIARLVAQTVAPTT